MSTGAMTGPQVLMRRLRAIMRSEMTHEARLAEIVHMVAGAMVSEVCSVYLMQPGEMLELFETKGLNPEAVHNTRLAVGQGLVGHVAESSKPLRIRRAPSHPRFEMRPETGEEIYRSMLSVPILHSGKVVGVLTVQNILERDYTADEQEALETVAMGLAEMIATGALVSPNLMAETLQVGRGPARLSGLPLADGVAKGLAVLHTPRVEVTHSIADDPRIERWRLDAAISNVQKQIDAILAQPALAEGESRDVMEAFRMFAHDPGWQRRMREGVEANLTAEAAVKRARDQLRARFEQVPDPYIRARAADMDDLANRLMASLHGGASYIAAELPDDVILVARDMGPSELLDFGADGKLRGIVLEGGAANSHMSIVARTLGVPVIGRVAGATEKIDPDDVVILDAPHHQVFVRPDDHVTEAFNAVTKVRAAEEARRSELKDKPAVSLDGVRVTMLCNGGLLLDLRHLGDVGAEGVGLFRTELHFMVRGRLPRTQEQTEYYRSALELADGKPVTFRTLDIGGDKLLPSMKRDSEENPAMGWRAIRISLDNQGLFRMQLRALIAASAGQSLSLMFPMVTGVAEFRAARAVLDREIAWAKKQGRTPPSELRVGVMLEVPALVWNLRGLLPQLDFVSVGSNDLMQFLFAADRGSPRIADRYDTLDPAFLSVLRHIVSECAEAGAPLSICGEMAGRPLEALALLGVGFTRLSMNAGAIGAVKELVLKTDIGALKENMKNWLDKDDQSLRPRLQEFADRNEICT